MEMKTLSIVLMAVIMLAMIAMPIIAAEDNETSDSDSSDDSSDAIALYNDTSDLPEDTVIAPAPDAADDEDDDAEDVEADDSEDTDDAEEEVEIEEEAEEDMNESAGAGKVAWTNIKLWFTFNQEKKIQLEIQLAKLQLIRAKIAAKNNDSEAVEKALEAHERIMERVQARMSAMGTDSGEDINATAVKLRGLERAIQVHEIRIDILTDILENANITEEQREKIGARLSHLQNVTAQLSEINEEKKAKLVTKLMAVSNISEDEAKDLIGTGNKIHDIVKNNIQTGAKERPSDDSDDEDSDNETEDADDSDDSEDENEGENESEED